jgi:hypothetical protein
LASATILFAKQIWNVKQGDEIRETSILNKKSTVLKFASVILGLAIGLGSHGVAFEFDNFGFLMRENNTRL